MLEVKFAVWYFSEGGFWFVGYDVMVVMGIWGIECCKLIQEEMQEYRKVLLLLWKCRRAER
jgi:hypothetical protein